MLINYLGQEFRKGTSLPLLHDGPQQEDKKTGAGIIWITHLSVVDTGCQLGLLQGLFAETPTCGFSMKLLRLHHNVVARFQKQAPQKMGSGNCSFYTAWTWKLAQHHFGIGHGVLELLPKFM